MGTLNIYKYITLYFISLHNSTMNSQFFLRIYHMPTLDGFSDITEIVNNEKYDIKIHKFNLNINVQCVFCLLNWDGTCEIWLFKLKYNIYLNLFVLLIRSKNLQMLRYLRFIWESIECSHIVCPRNLLRIRFWRSVYSINEYNCDT